MDKLIANGWQIFLAISTVIGFISAILGFKSSFETKKENKRLKFMLDNLDQSITLKDKTLAIKEKDDEISKKNEELNEIPLSARKMVLEGTIGYEMTLLSESYGRLKRLQSQLNDLGEKTDTRNSLLADVAKEIEPTYSLKRSQNTLTTLFLFVSVITSLLSIYLPGIFIRQLMLLLQVIIGGRIVFIGLRSNYSRDEIRSIATKTCLIASAVSLALMIALTGLFSFLEGDLWLFILIIYPLTFIHFATMFASFVYSKLSKFKIWGLIIFGIILLSMSLLFLFGVTFINLVNTILLLSIFVAIMADIVLMIFYSLRLFGKTNEKA